MSESKLRILTVAENLFMEKGYEVVKLRDIADALGIKQPSLYYHFPDGKEQIYVEVVMTALKRLNIQLENLITSHGSSIRQTMLAIGRWAHEEMKMSPVVMTKVDMPLLSQENQRKISKMLFENIFFPIQQMFQRGIDTGIIREVNTFVITGILLSMIEAMEGNIDIGEDRMKSWMESIDIILQGLIPRE